jgi:hypothetical protein
VCEFQLSLFEVLQQGVFQLEPCVQFDHESFFIVGFIDYITSNSVNVIALCFTQQNKSTYKQLHLSIDEIINHI